MKKMQNISYNRNNILLSTTIFFIFIFDSGGGMGIRNFGLLLIITILFIEIFYNHKKNELQSGFLLFYFFSMTFLMFSVLIAFLNNTSFFKSNLFNFSLYCLLPFYMLAKRKYITIDGYLNAVKIFCIIILIFFFGRLFRIMPLVNIFNFVVRNADGYFGNKRFSNSITVLPNIYFQGTLVIIPAAIIMIIRRNYGSFFLVLLTLSLIVSRFGVLVCILFFLILNIKKIYVPLSIVIILLLCVQIFRIEIPVFIDFLDVFYRNSSGNVIRSKHLESIISLFMDNPSYFILGQGPGSVFYTSGFNVYTDSVEISHFDVLRKYGIIYFCIINAAFFYLMYKIYRKSKETRQFAYGLLAHYIVSISNPVLLSLPFIMFLSICIVNVESKYTLHIKNIDE